MPVRMLEDTQSVGINQFDVIGFCEKARDFVSHVGLASEPLDEVTTETAAVRLTHMKPPLRMSDAVTLPHCVGGLALTIAEQRKIRLFAQRLFEEFEEQGLSTRQQYGVLPQCRKDSSRDSTTIWQQFSCTTFVVTAYAKARIDFIETREELLPRVDLETLKKGWRRALVRRYEDAQLRADELNLQGDGPWPVLMPGYVLNALDREDAAIRNSRPYRAQPGDEYFPRRTS